MNKINLKVQLLTLLLIVGFNSTFAQLNDSVYVKTSIFEVSYNENLEGPNWVKYHATNRPTNVNRGHMNFYKEKEIHTSDSFDYVKNVWDKGHMAPAALFSDNMENLKQTFSYLNCSLQNQYLNRGAWRFLESEIRKWDDSENLTIVIIPIYENGYEVLPTGGSVPTSYHKHIKWDVSGKKECYFFPNVRPDKGWKEYINKNCSLIEQKLR